MLRISELLTLMSKLFRKRWNEAEAKAKDTKAAMRLYVSAIEKKIAQFLDRTWSRTATQ